MSGLGDGAGSGDLFQSVDPLSGLVESVHQMHYGRWLWWSMSRKVGVVVEREVWLGRAREILVVF